MPKLFQTKTFLPDFGNRRFGSLNIGYDKIGMMLEEHAKLTTACAKLLGVETDALTIEDVDALANRELVPVPVQAPSGG